MVWARRFWLRLQTLFRRRRSTQRLNDEVQFHLDQQIAENIAAGMSHEEARHAARRTFGNPTFLKEETRNTWGWIWLEQIGQDLRLGLRMLCKNPGFACTVILTLGLGIGMNSAIFTVANGFLLRKPPIKDPNTVVTVTMTNPLKGRQRDPATPAEFMALRQDSHLFDDTAALQLEDLPLTGRGDPQSVTVARVTFNYFALLGVPATVGRTFRPDESQAEGKFNAVISFDLWQRTFDADPGIIGKTLTLAGQVYTVIGIMPDVFKYAFVPCAVWIPDSFDAQPLDSTQSEKRDLNVFARLRPRTTLRYAPVQTNGIIERLAQNSPCASSKRHSLRKRCEFLIANTGNAAQESHDSA